MAERIIILSASTGNGHTSAANALKEEFESRGHVVMVIDCMDHVAKMFRRWFKGGYEMLVKESPWLWGHLYRTSDRPLFNYWVQTFLDYKCSWPLDDVIREFNPTWILCTHSIAQPRLPKLREELKVPVAVVVTDLYPHRMWLRGNPDWYFLPTEESQETLEARNPETKGQGFVTGIPINEAFANAPTQEAARVALGMDSRPAVLISSGGIGAGPFEEVASELADLPIRLNVVAGRSQVAFEGLTSKFGARENVHIYGHVPQSQMAELMAASDMLVGKSGGLTTFEALAVGCPFLVYMPFLIPGQEEDNAEFLQDIGAGRVVRDLADLKSQILSLLNNPEALNRMRVSAKAHAKPNARQEIVDIMLRLDKKSPVLSGR